MNSTLKSILVPLAEAHPAGALLALEGPPQPLRSRVAKAFCLALPCTAKVLAAFLLFRFLLWIYAALSGSLPQVFRHIIPSPSASFADPVSTWSFLDRTLARLWQLDVFLVEPLILGVLAVLALLPALLLGWVAGYQLGHCLSLALGVAVPTLNKAGLPVTCGRRKTAAGLIGIALVAALGYMRDARLPFGLLDCLQCVLAQSDERMGYVALILLPPYFMSIAACISLWQAFLVPATASTLEHMRARFPAFLSNCLFSLLVRWRKHADLACALLLGAAVGFLVHWVAVRGPYHEALETAHLARIGAQYEDALASIAPGSTGTRYRFVFVDGHKFIESERYGPPIPERPDNYLPSYWLPGALRRVGWLRCIKALAGMTASSFAIWFSLRLANPASASKQAMALRTILPVIRVVWLSGAAGTILASLLIVGR